MSNAISIRMFREGDEFDCMNVLISSFEWYLKLPGTRWLYEKFSPESLRLESMKGFSLVAEKGGKIVGYAHCDIALYGVGYLSTIGVAPSLQGSGIGSSLLKQVETKCRRLGLRKIWLMVTHINTRALTFYLMSGYEINGFMRDMTARGLHEVIMSKDLEST